MLENDVFVVQKFRDENALPLVVAGSDLAR